MYFLIKLDSLDNIPDIFKEEIFEEAFKVAEVAGMTRDESLKIFRENINVINTAE